MKKGFISFLVFCSLFSSVFSTVKANEDEPIEQTQEEIIVNEDETTIDQPNEVVEDALTEEEKYVFALENDADLFRPEDFITEVTQDYPEPIEFTSACKFEIGIIVDGEVMPSGECFEAFEEAKEVVEAPQVQTFSSFSEVQEKAVLVNGLAVSATYAIFFFDNSNTNTTFSIYSSPSVTSKRKAYINPGSQNDALLIDSVVSNGELWQKIRISGVTGYIQASKGSVIPVSNLPWQTLNEVPGPQVTRYYTYTGSTGDINFGYQVLRGYGGKTLEYAGFSGRPANINKTDDGPFYSYDGNYYYTNLVAMIDDARENSYSRAINAGKPYFDYYMYLPGRSKTTFTGDDYNKYLLIEVPDAANTITMCYSADGYGVSCNGNEAYKYVGPKSVLYNKGNDFITHQNNYGVNGTMIYGKGILESGWGRSTLSYAKLNLFGVGAYDSSPFTSATKFNSVYDGIRSQFQSLMSGGFFNPSDWRYGGSHLGNKASGVNMQYAADPNWGFKIAYRYRLMDFRLNKKDMNLYQLAVTTNGNTKMYQNSTGETSYYTIGQNVATANNNYIYEGKYIPFIVLGEENGRYKVIRDGATSTDGTFDFSNVGYVNKSDVTLINVGKNGYFDPRTMSTVQPTEQYVSVTPTPYQLVANTSIQTTNGVIPALKGSYVIVVGKYDKDSTHKAKIRFSLGASGTYMEGFIDSNLLKVAYDSTIGETTASSIRVRQDSTTTSAQVGMLDAIGTLTVILGTKSGQNVGGVSQWYKIANGVKDNSVGYILANSSWVIKKTTPVVSVLPTDFIPPAGTGVAYNGQKQDGTWISFVKDGATLGSDGANLKGLHMYLYGAPGTASINYQVYNGSQWTAIESNGNLVESTNIKGLKINLANYPNKNISYRVYLRGKGWTAWYKNGAQAGDLTSIIDQIEVKLANVNNGGTEEPTDPPVNPVGPPVNPVDPVVPSDPIPIVSDEWLYIKSMTMKDGKVSLSGHFALNNTTQTASTNIVYKLQFVDMITGKTYEYTLERWLSDVPYVVKYGNRDASGTWFRKDNIDISGLPTGDYQLYMISNISGTQKKALLSNLYLSFAGAKNNISGREFIMKTNYLHPKKTIELTIQPQIFSNSSIESRVNNLSTFTKLDIKDATLKLRGYAFNVGIDYNKNANVVRKIHFINVADQTVFSFDIGSIDSGDYPIPLVVNDGKDRTRAWFDSTIYLDKLPKGRYKIVVETATGGFSDDGELVMYTFNDLPSSSYNGKTYRFVRNDQIRRRVELYVE